MALADALVRDQVEVPTVRETATREGEGRWVVMYRVVLPGRAVIDPSHLVVEVDLGCGTARFFPVL